MTVDGVPATIGQQVDADTVSITVDDIPLPVAPDLTYYLAYKPSGVVTTADDPQGRPTVLELAPAEPRVFPVGRLDIDSEGLIVLTNDGDLTLRLTHPRFGVHKTYVALVQGRVDRAIARTLTDGVELEDGSARALEARIVDRMDDASIVEVEMGEGRNRIVRRMFDALGHPVLRLTRTAIGPVRERDLEPGRSRPLTISEVRSLYAAGEEPTDGQ